ARFGCALAGRNWLACDDCRECPVSRGPGGLTAAGRVGFAPQSLRLIEGLGTCTMKALAERWKPIALLLCLLLLALALTTFKTRLAPHASLFERMGLSVVMPLQQAIARLAQGLSGLWNGYINLVHVRQENVRLQRQVEALQGQLTHYQEAYVQQQRLRELLGFRALAFPQAVVAEVVGIDPSPWSEVVTINKGSRDNLRKDIAVATHRGLVGRTSAMG